MLSQLNQEDEAEAMQNKATGNKQNAKWSSS